jgi:hypothetical protein
MPLRQLLSCFDVSSLVQTAGAATLRRFFEVPVIAEPISLPRCCVCGKTTEIMCFDPGTADWREPPPLFLIRHGQPPRARCLEHWPIVSHGETRQNPAKPRHGQVSKA